MEYPTYVRLDVHKATVCVALPKMGTIARSGTFGG
jgi:hypothetical protein